MGISGIAQLGELCDFFGPPSSDLLVRYLSEAVIWDCSGKNTDQHRLRQTTQNIIIQRFGGDIVAFAQYLAKNSRYVALHFFNMSTESFLVLLFRLFPQPEMVFEARAKLLDWYGDHFKEPLAFERAKTLRLDQKLQKIRGDIDDTRIYVDPLRFGQWLQDFLLDELTNLLQPENISIADIRAFGAFGDFATNRQPHIHLAATLQSAFHEFCVNKRYGVDSYLGRRIRHGTLKGVMLTQVQAVLRKPKYALLLQQMDVNDYLNQWISRYESKIAEWGQEIFQIWSKQKHHGAISTDITGSDKIESTRTALADLVAAYQETKSVAVVLQTIFEHCWRLLEKDLSQIRMFIESQRLEWGTINRTELRSMVTDEGLKTLAAELARETNTLTEEKFRNLSRWFTKPTNLAPSASILLLLDAVLGEVKEHFSDYAPKIRRAGLSDVELFGMYYHHVYDFLNVVIYNAAKHGKRSGLLVQDIQIKESPGQPSLLQVSISSEKSDAESMEAAKSNINNAMSGSTDDAMVVEVRSGIKKLIRLSSDVKEISNFGVSFDDGLIRFNLSLELAPR
jgi:hypothetical protein